MLGCASRFPTLRFVGVANAKSVLGFFIYIFYISFVFLKRFPCVRLKFGFCNAKGDFHNVKWNKKIFVICF